MLCCARIAEYLDLPCKEGASSSQQQHEATGNHSKSMERYVLVTCNHKEMFLFFGSEAVQVVIDFRKSCMRST